MTMLAGKRALIVGLLSDRSIAYGIAESMHKAGAELAFTYQGEKVKDRVEKMARTFGAEIIVPCDVTDDAQIDAVFNEIEAKWGRVDIIVHSVAFAPQAELEGDYAENLTREGFRLAMDVSAYSLGALAKAGARLMPPGGAIVTLSYLGAERVVPNYNLMGVAKAALEANVRYLANSLGPKGIRVNAISAGPIRTLAASGIGGFRAILTYNEQVAPLRKNVTTEEVGNAATFLCSDMASGITGEILYVDAGFNIVAFPAP
ncbi:MAG: enoyl-ACP reductase [Gammaproteobacteria bacterium]